MDVVEGKLGDVGAYDVKFVDAKLVAELDVNVEKGVLTAGLVVKLDGSAVLDALAAAIPGQIDDVLLGVLKKALQEASKV